MKIADRFLDAIGRDLGNCVLIVGAGLSKKGVRRGGAGIPDWDQLMQLMISHLEDAGRVDTRRAEQLHALLEDTPPRYLDIAEEFLLTHSDDRDGYETFLRRHLRPDDLVKSELHRTILDSGFWGIVSYNFDMVFEKQSDRLNRIVYPDLMQQVGQFQRKGFFAKIHGCINGPASNLVLTRTGYEELRRHPRYVDLMKTVLFGHKVLCVGFSLRDPDFNSILADLKDYWGADLPPLYALMRDASSDERARWRAQGMDILTYDDHAQIKQFFAELANLRPERRPSGVKNTKGVDTLSLLAAWEAARTIEDMDLVLERQLRDLKSPEAKEVVLSRLAALCQPNQAPHLCRQLVTLATLPASELARRLFNEAVEAHNLAPLKPHAMNAVVHEWFRSRNDWTFFRDRNEQVLKWLLDREWARYGVDLWATFSRVLGRVTTAEDREGLGDLYLAAQQVPGACEEIEKIVLARDFVREAQPNNHWPRISDQNAVRVVQGERFGRQLHEKPWSPREMIAHAVAFDAEAQLIEPPVCTEMAAERLLDEYVQRTHLTLQGSSSLYDPTKAREIVDALADLRSPHQQMSVLWAINRWPEQRRGLLSLAEDLESLRSGLFVPLWWRYASFTRLEYLGQRHRGHSAFPAGAGQQFLCGDLMGLRCDIDRDYRDWFDQDLDAHRDPKTSQYEPRPSQEVWRDRDLSYCLLKECPPELVRRVAIRRVDWENSQPASVRWAEATDRADELLTKRQDLQSLVSVKREDYVIDNLLGTYLPAKRDVVLYEGMISYAAKELAVDEDALGTVVYIHESVHAFSHLGRDLNGRMWDGYALPSADAPDAQPNRLHEGIAQYYTHKLLEWLDDPRLLGAFVALERASVPAYRAWRQTEHYSLEAMREILVRCRSTGATWPPDFRVCLREPIGESPA